MASEASGCPSVMTVSRPNESAVWMHSVSVCPVLSLHHQSGLYEAFRPNHYHGPEFLFRSLVSHPSDFYVHWVSQVQLLSVCLRVFHVPVWRGPVLHGLE